MIKLKDLLEKSGAGDWGTDELRKTLEKGTPGQGITDIGLKNKDRKESVEFAESEYKVIKVVGDDYKKMKKGRSYGTFPATDKGRDQATSFQLKLKRQKGIEADLVWESLDEANIFKKLATGGKLLKPLATALTMANNGELEYVKNNIETAVKILSKTSDKSENEIRKAMYTMIANKTKNKQIGQILAKMASTFEEVELDEISRMTKMKAAIARGIRGPSKKATPTWARETGKAAKELKKRAAQTAEYEKKKKAMQQKGALTSFKPRKEEVDLDEARKYKVVKGDKERMINKQELRTYMQMGWKQVKEGKSFKEIAEKACWKSYKQIGTKKKNGKEVPNCVPEEKE